MSARVYASNAERQRAYRARKGGKSRDPYYDPALMAYAGSCRCDQPLPDPASGDCVRCGHGRIGDLIVTSDLYVPLATIGRETVTS